jgi:hypothetical protein
MKATLLFRDKKTLASGALIEMVIWKLPQPDPERPHGYKYRLYYGRGGKRLIGYDNERGKADHRHNGDREELYPFVSVEQLIDDFLADVRREEAI